MNKVKRLVFLVLIARGRDAADVPLTHSFGKHELKQFEVWIDKIEEDVALAISLFLLNRPKLFDRCRDPQNRLD